MSKILEKIESNHILILVILNYLIYFLFEKKFLFPYFSLATIVIFISLLIVNFRSFSYIIILVFIFSLISLGSPVADWDSRSIWLFNAKKIYFNNNLKDYFSYGFAIDYPILVQTFSASLASLIGTWNEIFPKFSNVILILPPLLVIAKILSNKLEKLIILILIVFIYEKRLINGDMDALLSLYTLSSTILVINFFLSKKNKFGDYITILLHLIMLTSIKVEGIGIFSCIIISLYLIFYKHGNKEHNKLLLVCLLSLFPIISWKIFVYLNDITPSSQKMISSGERVIQNFQDLKFLLILIKHIILNKQMIISLFIFVIALNKYIKIDKSNLQLKISKNLFSNEILFILTILFFYSSLLFLIFVASEGSTHNLFDMKYFMAISSSERLFLPIHSLIVMCSIFLIKNKFKN